MSPKYKVIQGEYSQTIERTNADGSVSYIPCDESNSDYQRYLRWLENPDAEENGTIS